MLQYKQSYYNFVVSSREYVCLYNSKTGCVGVLKEDEAKVIEILENPDEFIETELFKDLLDSQFIIENEKNEIYEVASNFDKANKNDTCLNIIILPTEACNFSCPYCFVKEEKLQMDKTIYDSLLRFIDKQYEQYRIKYKEPMEVTIGWFGGEPTLCVSSIIEFMQELTKRGKQLKVQGKIVTNGYLLTTELFFKLINSQISNFQITLDGTSENHDIYRTLKNGAGTFDTIYSNLKKIHDEFPEEDFEISIRGNFNKENIPAMEKLAKKFLKDFGEDQRFDLSFRPILDYEQKKNTDGCNNITFCSKQEALEIQSELASYIYQENNLNTANRMFDVLPEPINKWCNVTRLNSIIIDPKGNIFACDSIVSDKTNSIGKMELDGNITLNENAKIWKQTIFQTDKYAECQQCKLLPVCLGGCTRERINKGCGCCTWTVKYIESMMRKYCKG